MSRSIHTVLSPYGVFAVALPSFRLPVTWSDKLCGLTSWGGVYTQLKGGSRGILPTLLSYLLYGTAWQSLDPLPSRFSTT